MTIKSDDILVPELCRNSFVLALLVYEQLAISIAFLFVSQSFAIERYAFVSVYSHILCLLVLACLCLIREKINQLPKRLGVCVIVLLISLVGLILELLIFVFLHTAEPLSSYLLSQSAARLAGIFLLSLLMVSFFNTLSVQVENRSSGVKNHYQALQARIRPHFLFNSLNTIAELTQFDKDSAEQAIQSLSTLFRAGLGDIDKLHSMEDEIKLCKDYLQLERWRLGDKLCDSWQVNVADLGKWKVSKLMLQPLVENAVIHGAFDTGHVSLKVDVRETEDELAILVENQVSAANKSRVSHDGNGMAIDNIRSRLRFLYDDKHKFKVRSGNDVYQVFIRIPKLTEREYDSLL